MYSLLINNVSHYGRIGSEEVFLFHLANGSMDVYITNYGATITAITIPGTDGVKRNVVAGFNSLNNYLQPHPYLGCIVGRFANRIAEGRFAIDENHFTLSVNNPPNHLHGGYNGFDRKVWKLKSSFSEEDTCGITLACFSEDGEEGYPGNVSAEVSYVLTRNNALQIQYEATTDRDTIVNLTNHSYFNLSGFRNETIKDHILHLPAEKYAEKNRHGIPTGVLPEVADGPLDFRKPRVLHEVLAAFPQDGGLDHFFVTNPSLTLPTHAATLSDTSSGITLEVWTDQPGCQVYTANFWDGSLTGSEGNPLIKHGAIAIETQNFPDAPNHPGFPSSILRSGEVYRAFTSFKFV